MKKINVAYNILYVTDVDNQTGALDESSAAQRQRVQFANLCFAKSDETVYSFAKKVPTPAKTVLTGRRVLPGVKLVHAILLQAFAQRKRRPQAGATLKASPAHDASSGS